MGHPEIKRGGGHRRARPEVGRARRWPASCSSDGADADQGRTCSTSSRRKVAKWQLPDDVVFIDEVPKTSVGKFSKKTLRDEFAGALMNE